ncbi:predicted protein [Naegleria gruberi]|uniref:Predicted protein n=1 Tax=Naegleria gruberi TaxID=5762 RepID=D2W6E4_NAEGR|nr:uncharacterized protein NAEGRDRAFT_76987 [Naegleria gruberi]EFC35358.1 predicted protein [Naegleria gruberi]|eukprot:XP_002668102.1 predicted protein [Naegleria gruberi strain NEG-M]
MLNDEHSTVSTPRGSSSKQSSSDRIETLLSEYKFRIEAIFDYSPARDTFRKYLKKVCLNEEPFMFYEMVENYQKTRLDKNRLELAADIINQFIVVNSKHELNMSMAIRNEILKQHAQILEKNQNLPNLELLTCPSDLFANAQDVIFTELKQDNFPRFVRSKEFKKFIMKEFKKNETIFEMLGDKKDDDGELSFFCKFGKLIMENMFWNNGNNWKIGKLKLL